MARIRTLKPEFWADEKLAPLDPVTRLVFLGLLSMADDAGRLVDSLKQIDAFVFPETDDTARDALANLSRGGRILRGRTASGQRIIQIANWTRHQKVDHPNLRAALPEIVSPHMVTTPRETIATESRDVRAALATRPVPTTSTNDQRPTTDEGPAAAASELPPESPDYVTRCVIAMNAGLSENPDLGRTANPVPASGQVGAVSWQADGIPLELAEEIIRERSRAYRPTPRHRQPNSLRYFDAAVREAHERQTVTPEDEDARFARLKAKLEAQEAVA